MMPKVSICIPTFNYAHYLPETIDSILAQSYSDFELIIVDDCSTDNTAELMPQYAQRDPRIRFYRNERNLGMVENWNRCLDLARGEYVKIMGADDILEPACIEKSIQVLSENPGVAVVSSARLLIDGQSRPLRVEAFADAFRVTEGKTIIKICFFTGNRIGEPVAVTFRKHDADRGFDSRYRQLTDLEMWFHLLERGDFAFIPDVLCRFRVHGAQATKANIQSLKFIDDNRLLFADYFSKGYIGNSGFNRIRWRFNLCYVIWDHGFQGLSRETIREQIRNLFPLWLFYPLLLIKLFFLASRRAWRFVKKVLT